MRCESSQYFVHTDHLGSSNHITDISGEVYQHCEYLPFGELFVEERNTEQDRFSYLYNGKELDEMTGLSYYGARYYNPRDGIWLGVDPLAEKYPGLSAFCYVANNPIILKDPDGRIITAVNNSSQDVASFFSTVFANWSEMEKFVQVTTDENGNTTYYIPRGNFGKFVRAAGYSYGQKNAARIIGRLMRTTSYKLNVDTKTTGISQFVGKDKYNGTAFVNADKNSSFRTIAGEEKESSLNQRIGHELGEAFFSLMRLDFTKNPTDGYDDMVKKYESEFSGNNNENALEQAISIVNDVYQEPNIEVIQYENIFQRCLYPDVNESELRGGDLNHGVSEPNARSGATAKQIEIQD